MNSTSRTSARHGTIADPLHEKIRCLRKYAAALCLVLASAALHAAPKDHVVPLSAAVSDTVPVDQTVSGAWMLMFADDPAALPKRYDKTDEKED